MIGELQEFLDRAMPIWASGGVLMLPLFVLTIIIYGSGFDLWLRLRRNILIRSRIDKRTESEIESGQSPELKKVKSLLLLGIADRKQINRHFEEIRSASLPLLHRRIRFLAILVSSAPLLGLLGTVMGMFSTFSGMSAEDRSFDLIIEGISEALITTQTGLLIAIPSMAMLSFIRQRQKTLILAIDRLERFNALQIFRRNDERNIPLTA